MREQLDAKGAEGFGEGHTGFDDLAGAVERIGGNSADMGDFLDLGFGFDEAAGAHNRASINELRAGDLSDALEIGKGHAQRAFFAHWQANDFAAEFFQRV